MLVDLNLEAPAKVNLSFDILGRRNDGFHTVKTVMQTIRLSDKIGLSSRSDGSIKIHCSHPFVPSGAKNLAYKAAALLKDFSGKPGLGVEITIDKRIPIAAGLGGGSADAAAVLTGLNRLWRLGLSQEQLARLAPKLGADVSFCLAGGTALAEGIGERLTRLQSPPRLWVVLLKPAVNIITAHAYNQFDPKANYKRPDTDRLLMALDSGDLDAFSTAAGNVFEGVIFPGLPLLQRIKQSALKNGALVAQMSGSGPTIFALARDYQKARKIYDCARQQVDFACISTFEEVVSP